MSNLFEWNTAKYGLGVPDMDREHQHLIGLMNKLHALHEAKASKSEVGRALQELAKYTVKHFADEEAHMASMKFPGIDKHKLIHAELLRRVGDHVKAFEASGHLRQDFFPFLTLWLKAHICNIDMKYAKAPTAA